MKRVRTRFAPSPTGPLHIGGVRTALFAYLLAKKHEGDFLLRIEDTDQTRYVEGAENYIIKALNWVGIRVDEGIGAEQEGPYAPYRQSERKPMYRQYAEQLVAQDQAYYAFDTSEELEEMRKRLEAAKVPSPQYNAQIRETMRNSLTLPEEEVQALLNNGTPYVIRLKVPRNQEIRFKDLIRSWVVFNSNDVDDKVLLKSDGMPTYHLASVVDDHLMEITHVTRGEEWLPSAPAHILLYEYFNWEQPEFAHLPLILKPEGHGKLSKRDGDKFGFPSFPLSWQDPETKHISKGYNETGFYPEAVVNFLALLGWSAGDNKELYTLSELIEAFDITRINKAGAKFNYEKAKWFNQQYLRQKDAVVLGNALVQQAQDKGLSIGLDTATAIAELVKERCTFEKELFDESSFFFEAPTSYDETVLAKKWNAETSPKYIQDLITQFKTLSSFDAATLDAAFKGYLQENGLKIGDLMPLLRVLITGKGAGASIFEISAILGQEETLKRLEQGLEACNKA